MKLPVTVKGDGLPLSQDYLFQSSLPGGYNLLTDCNLGTVVIRNDSDEPKKILEKTRLGVLTEMDETNAYAAHDEDSDLAYEPSKTDDIMVSRPDDPALETSIDFGITAYGKSEIVQRIREVVREFPDIWKESDHTVKIPESHWLTIPLKEGWDDTKVSQRAYPLGAKDRAVVDEEFDRLHRQKKMDWTERPTPFGAPVFVVWKTVHVGPEKIPNRKARVVVDIRALNKISATDSYPLPLQGDIISAVRGCKYISTVDATGFFHQWNVATADREKLTVTSHRGQEHFNVAVMGYKNSPPYVQRQMDRILREFQGFSRAFIDDIVIFSESVDEHLSHLRAIFSLFNSMNITLKATKSFLGYPSVTLLGQKVDGLGLTTSAEKLEAISSIKFPATLRDLEIYLGLTGYMRNYVPLYSLIARPLQETKTRLLKDAPNHGKERLAFTRKSIINPTSDEIEAFEAIQEYFRQETMLVHFDPARCLYIDLDASGLGFGVVAYHLRGETGTEKTRIADIQPILFLSRLLNTAEKNYWPTELEVACLVWSVRKLRHYIKSVSKTVVFTDHGATPGIASQTTLRSVNSDKLNKRLI